MFSSLTALAAQVPQPHSGGKITILYNLKFMFQTGDRKQNYSGLHASKHLPNLNVF
jgi:hypothetical protein